MTFRFRKKTQMLDGDLMPEEARAGDVSVAQATSVLIENGLAPVGLTVLEEAPPGQSAFEGGQATFATLPPRVTAYRGLAQLGGWQSEPEAVGGKTLEDRVDDLERMLSRTEREVDKLRRRLALAELAANTDALTGIPNRRRFEDVLGAAVVVARRFNEPLSLLMIDVDHFKQFNDDFGHAVGDHVLRFVAGALAQPWNEESFAARYGGEEFAMLALRTRGEEAVDRAELVRRRVARHQMIMRGTGERLSNITVSIGVAELGPTDTRAGFLRRADAALYAAKRAGRDRVMALRM